MICLETALPAKFEDTVMEAVGHPAERPARFADIENLPKYVEVIENDIEKLKSLIAEKLSES